MGTVLYDIKVWGTLQKDITSLESAHKDMVRIVQDLPWGVVCAGVVIPLGWSSVKIMVWRKRSQFAGKTHCEDSFQSK